MRRRVFCHGQIERLFWFVVKNQCFSNHEIARGDEVFGVVGFQSRKRSRRRPARKENARILRVSPNGKIAREIGRALNVTHILKLDFDVVVIRQIPAADENQTPRTERLNAELIVFSQQCVELFDFFCHGLNKEKAHRAKAMGSSSTRLRRVKASRRRWNQRIR